MTIKRYKTGDVFYVPLGESAKNKLDAAGNPNLAYIPNAKGLVCLGQVIYGNPSTDTLIAFYDKLYEQREVANVDLEDIYNQNPILIENGTTAPLTRKWWPMLGNVEVKDDLPVQARLTTFLQEKDPDDSLYWVSDYRTFGQPDGSTLIKQVSKEVARTLLRDHSITNGIFLDVAASYFGLIPWPYPDSSYEKDYKPRVEAAVWNIFPEHYDFGNHVPRIQLSK